jgi:hypothetical protein
MSCAIPLETRLLSDYSLGALTSDEEARVEEHFLSCADCGAELEREVALAEALRKLATGASLTMIVSPEFLRRAAEKGMRVREYPVTPGGAVQCTVTPEDDFLIGRLQADLHGASRLDLSICNERGVELVRLADIPFDAGSGEVVWQQSITYAKAAPSGSMMARLLSVKEPATELLLGEYIFIHTRTMPGPPGW